MGSLKIHLVPAERREQLRQIRSLYRMAFPLRERKPFAMILHKRKQGQMEIFAVEDETGAFLGEVITILHRDILLLDYFAVAPEHRGKGVGQAALEKVMEHAGERRLLLEIETTKKPSENIEERLRRKHFYQRCGMEALPFSVNLFGVEMELMTDRRSVTFEEYQNLFETVFGKEAAKHVRLIK